ncbi:MAG TPA: hypothetical protein VN521_09015 [Negativicutes bacterium]|nr:hypothetical protein [Negativicutes bacterium]
MAAFRKKKSSRGPYDKIVKYAQDLIRQELAPVRVDQQAIRTQNDKITEYVRQIWSSVEKRDSDEDVAQG